MTSPVEGGPALRPVLGVIGLGHVGLPTALSFAELGWTVVGADDDRQKAQQIAAGTPPFFEPGLRVALQRHLANGRFSVAREVAEAVRNATVLFVCVGTPQNPDWSADLSHVEQVALAVARAMDGYRLIVEKSTTPVRTAERIRETITRVVNGKYAFDVAVNPEFLREGTAMHDALNPERVVLGVESPRARELLLSVYAPLLARLGPGAADRTLVTDLNTAEIIKHASNAFLATKISFINMVGDLCQATGADVLEVARGLGMDPRIGSAFLQAGVGFGGYCLPKDLRAFTRIGEEHGVDMRLLKAVDGINEQRIEALVGRLRRHMWVMKQKQIAVWGVAFKPGTDDVREAPSLRVARRLLDEGGNLRVFDPYALQQFQAAIGDVGTRITYCDSALEATRGADALVVLTEWPEFQNVDLVSVREAMLQPIIVDGRNWLDAKRARALGFAYSGMGR